MIVPGSRLISSCYPRRALAVAAALTVLAAGATSAAAQEVNQYGAFLVDPSAPDTIILNDGIDVNDHLAFDALLSDYPGARYLVLNSPGGVVGVG